MEFSTNRMAEVFVRYFSILAVPTSKIFEVHIYIYILILLKKEGIRVNQLILIHILPPAKNM